jgi:hypothetical protein
MSAPYRTPFSISNPTRICLSEDTEEKPKDEMVARNAPPLILACYPKKTPANVSGISSNY